MRLPSLHRLALRPPTTDVDASEEEQATAAPPYQLNFDDIPPELHPLIYEQLASNDPCQRDTVRACNNAANTEMHNWCASHFRQLCHTGVLDPNNLVGYQPPPQVAAPYRCNILQGPNGLWLMNGNAEYSPYLAPNMLWMRQFALFCNIEHGRVGANVTPQRRQTALALLRRFGDGQLQYLPLGAFRFMPHVDLDTLPDSIQTIGPGAFEGCRGITRMQLPQGVRRIGQNAFAYCVNLLSIDLPDTIHSMEDAAFTNCRRLERLTFPNHPYLTQIRYRMCSNCVGLTHVIIPDNYRDILSLAFDFCRSLVSVTVSRNLSSIQNGAFRNCMALQRIGIGPDGTGGLPDTLHHLNAQTFFNCISLETMTLPPLITTIPDFCFENCTALHTININPGITYISDRAFVNCTALARVNLPMSLLALHVRAFEGCAPELILARGTDVWLASQPEGRFGNF